MAAPLIERNQSPEAEYHSVFEWNLIIQVGLICWILFLKSLVPAKWLGLSPLQPGKTKLAIENLAERFNFPLGYIYTCANDNKARVDSDAVIFGNFWRMNIVLWDYLLEKGDTEDVVALLAHEIATWKQSPFVIVIMGTLLDLSRILPCFILMMNWKDICYSFDFKGESYTSWVWPAIHPVMIMILLLGGATAPFHTAVMAFIRAASREMETQSDKFAVKNGYGPQLARALIKTNAHRDVGDGPEGDWLYLMFRSDGHLLLSERLEALGWTGEEEISKKRWAGFTTTGEQINWLNCCEC